jgi:hypothetical protein
MINPFYTDRFVAINLSCQAVNTEYSLIAEQICLLTDAFEKKINKYSKNQLLFLKAYLILHEDVKEEGINSFINYRLFLVEEKLKKM